MNPAEAQEIMQSAHCMISNIKDMVKSMTIKGYARRGFYPNPFLVKTCLEVMERKLPMIREAATQYHNGPDFVKEFEDTLVACKPFGEEGFKQSVFKA